MRTLHSYERLGRKVKAVMELVRYFGKELQVLQRTLRLKEWFNISHRELDDKITASLVSDKMSGSHCPPRPNFSFLHFLLIKQTKYEV